MMWSKIKRPGLYVFAAAAIVLLLIQLFTTNRSVSSQAHSPQADSVTAAAAPTLQVTSKVSGRDLHLQMTVTGFTFSLENMGKENRYGEGHVHLYIDDKKVAKIFAPQFVWKDVQPGSHQVVVELAHNNHESYGVKQSFQIHVK